MAAIRTKNYSVSLARLFYKNIYEKWNTDKAFYVFTADPVPIKDDWNNDIVPPTPSSNAATALFEAWDKMLNMIKVQAGGVSRVIPRNVWTEGTVYYPWTWARSGKFIETHLDEPWYVETEDVQENVTLRNVYVCLYAPRNRETGEILPSSIRPSGNGVQWFFSSDGYVWKYLYTITHSEEIRFSNANFIPVREDPDPDCGSDILPGSPRAMQLAVMETAVSGEVFEIEVTYPGENLLDGTWAITLLNGTTLSVPIQDYSGEIVIKEGKVVSVNMTVPGMGYAPRTQVKFLEAILNSGTGTPPKFFVNVTPKIGTETGDFLGAKWVAVNTRHFFNEDDRTMTNNDFRRIGIIQGPREITAAPCSKDYYSCLWEGEINLVLDGMEEDQIWVSDNDNKKSILIVGISEDRKKVWFIPLGAPEGYGDIQDYAWVPSLNEYFYIESRGNAQNTKFVSLKEPLVAWGSGDILISEIVKPRNRANDQIESYYQIFAF